MAPRNVLLVFLLAAVAVFSALNWSVITAPTPLSLGFTELQAPLGLVLLGLMALLTAVFVLYLLYLQTGALLEARRHARELQASRELADQAEASRFTELRAFLETRMNEVESSLSAQLGELRDRLDRSRPPA